MTVFIRGQKECYWIAVVVIHFFFYLSSSSLFIFSVVHFVLSIFPYIFVFVWLPVFLCGVGGCPFLCLNKLMIPEVSDSKTNWADVHVVLVYYQRSYIYYCSLVDYGDLERKPSMGRLAMWALTENGTRTLGQKDGLELRPYIRRRSRHFMGDWPWEGEFEWGLLLGTKALPLMDWMGSPPGLLIISLSHMSVHVIPCYVCPRMRQSN